MNNTDLSSTGKRKKERGSLFVAKGFLIGIVLISILLSVFIYYSSWNPGVPSPPTFTLQQSSTATNYTLMIAGKNEGTANGIWYEDAYLVVIFPTGNHTNIPFKNISGVWYRDAIFKDNDHTESLTLGDSICLNKGPLFNLGMKISIADLGGNSRSNIITLT